MESILVLMLGSIIFGFSIFDGDEPTEGLLHPEGVDGVDPDAIPEGFALSSEAPSLMDSAAEGDAPAETPVTSQVLSAAQAPAPAETDTSDSAEADPAEEDAEEETTATGSAGSDTFDLEHFGDEDTAPDEGSVNLTINNFDPEEDLLRIDPADATEDEVNVVLSEDEDGAFTDVVFQPASDDSDAETEDDALYIVRLAGVTGLDPDALPLVFA